MRLCKTCGSRYGDDPDFSLVTWLRLLFSFHGGARPSDSPFFVDGANRSVPLTYGKAMTQFRELLLAKVCSVEEAKTYGLHGLRVAGWNGARRGPAGEDLAIAQGGWHAGSQKRYDRFRADEVCALPQHILEGADAALSTSARMDPGPAPSPAAAPVVAAAQPAAAIPAGWRKRGSLYIGPDGKKLRSLAAVHRFLAAKPLAQNSQRKRGRSPERPALIAGPPPGRPSIVFPDDLSQHVVEADRPSSRRPPVLRHGILGNHRGAHER